MNRPRLLLAALVAAATACDGSTVDRQRRPDTGPDTSVVPDTVTGGADVADSVPDRPTSPASDSAGAAAIARFRARLPAAVLVRRGACPFECCTYREWTAEGAIAVVAAERNAGPPVFTLQPGQRFRADSGNVWITDLMLVAVSDTVGDPPHWSFAPGDTLVVLDHIGEGFFNVWHDGRVLEVEGFWEAWRQEAARRPEAARPDREAPAARTIGAHGTEWWVHITTADGRTGWFEAGPTVRIAGADACG